LSTVCESIHVINAIMNDSPIKASCARALADCLLLAEGLPVADHLPLVVVVGSGFRLQTLWGCGAGVAEAEAGPRRIGQAGPGVG